MGHSEDILKLRKRVSDAVLSGLVDPSLKDFYEATLLQVLNEAERQRQVCTNQAETFRKQASIADGQGAAYASIGSIVYNVLNMYILQAEKAKREEQARAEELAEKKVYAESLRELKRQKNIEEEMEETEIEDEEEEEEYKKKVEEKVISSRRRKK